MYRTIGGALNIKSMDLAPQLEVPDEEEEDANSETVDMDVDPISSDDSDFASDDDSEL
jgi:hypothetical protein